VQLAHGLLAHSFGTTQLGVASFGFERVAAWGRFVQAGRHVGG